MNGIKSKALELKALADNLGPDDREGAIKLSAQVSELLIVTYAARAELENVETLYTNLVVKYNLWAEKS